MVITILTGSLITLVTVGLMALMFKNVRIALFNVPELMRKIEVMNKELLDKTKRQEILEEKLVQLSTRIEKVKCKIVAQEKEIEEREKKIEELKLYKNNLQLKLQGLEKEINEKILKIRNLEQELERKEKGILVYRKEEPISVAVIKKGLSKSEILHSIKYFLQETRKVALKNGLTVEHKDFEKLWEKIKGSFEKVAVKIAHSNKEMVIGFIASSHLFKGDKIKGDFKMKPNEVLYRAGEEIYRFYLDGKQSKDDLYGVLKYYLNNFYQELRSRGRLGEVKLQEVEIFNILDKIIGKAGEVILKARKDIKVEGPMEIEVEVKEKAGEEDVKR